MTVNEVDFAKRVIDLFSDEWRAAKQKASQEWAEAIETGVLAYKKLLRANEAIRSLLEKGLPYDPPVDLILFALMFEWKSSAGEIWEQVQELERDESGLENDLFQSFSQMVSETEEMFNLSIPDDLGKEWKHLLEIANKLVHEISSIDWYSTYQAAKRSDLTSLQKIARVLRYRNMEASGVSGSELDEMSNLEQYPGTPLSELLEPIILRKAKTISEQIHWSQIK